MKNTGIHANTLLEVHRMYHAVGIDVSKGKSTVAVLQPSGTVIRKPFDVPAHPRASINSQIICVHWLVAPRSLWNVQTDTMNL